MTKLIWPPQVHMHVLELFKAGFLPISTVGEPGVQGAAVTGRQGWGVRAPPAAAVAAATCGFDGALHKPKGMMLLIGMLSMIVAAGALLALTRVAGRTIMALGAAPKVHCI
jgi:hypothetical protein